MESLISSVQQTFINKKDLPKFSSGDTITVYYEIREGEKVRTQFFKGVVIQIKGQGLTKSFTIKEGSHEVRRPLSGGELFALLLLVVSLLLSLFIAIGSALVQGKELQVRPSWLMVNQSMVCNVTLQSLRNVSVTFI